VERDKDANFRANFGDAENSEEPFEAVSKESSNVQAQGFESDRTNDKVPFLGDAQNNSQNSLETGRNESSKIGGVQVQALNFGSDQVKGEDDISMKAWPDAAGEVLHAPTLVSPDGAQSGYDPTSEFKLEETQFKQHHGQEHSHNLDDLETELQNTVSNCPSSENTSKTVSNEKYILFDQKRVKLSYDLNDQVIQVEDQDMKTMVWKIGMDANRLENILLNSQPLSFKLFTDLRAQSILLKSGEIMYELEGSLRDYDNPFGQPETITDLSSQKITWRDGQHNSTEEYDEFMRHSAILGTTFKVLHKLFEWNDKKLEVHIGEDGTEVEIVDLSSKSSVVWDRNELNAWDRFSDIMQEAEFVGYSLFTEFLPTPMDPEPDETTLNLAEWNIILVGEDKILFSLTAPRTPLLGQHLKTSLGIKQIKSSWQMKFDNEDERDDWYRHLRACKTWSEKQYFEKQRWVTLAAEFKSLHDDKALTLSQDVIQVEEDQLDAYRGKIVFLLDENYGSLSVSSLDVVALRKSKKIELISHFKTQLAKDLEGALGMKEDRKTRSRINVVSIANAKKKQSWQTDIKSPLFYLNLARKCSSGGVRVEVLLDPDSEYMDAALNDPDRAEFLAERDPTCKKSSKELIEEILMMHKLPVNSLQSGVVSKLITYAESRSAIREDEEEEDSGAIVGIPLWLELHFRNDFRKSQIKGSQKSHFNELFRFFVADDLGDSYIKTEVYTSTLFGKRLLGTTHLSLANVPPHQIVPITLSIDENEHGLIVAQVKLTPKSFTMPLDELKRKNNIRAQLKSSFPFLTLRDRHQTENVVDEQKLKELKQVLRVEANVYLDYPCCYDGLDHLGRVILRNLNQLGEQIAEDIFSCFRAHGNLQDSLKRPMELLTLERENTAMLRSTEAALCVGRNELLKSVQEYVHSIQSAPNRILLVCGPEGTGKTNLMAFVYSMFYKGIRIARNAHTGMLETISLASHNPSRRGHSWNEPEVIYASLKLSLGGTDMRWFLFSLMTMLSKIYHGCVYPTFDSTNLSKNNTLRLIPVPGEYNNLKLDFFNLCSVMDRLSPMKLVLILIDDIEHMDPLKFDWLPMSIPTSMRLIVTCKRENIVESINSENPALDVVTSNVPPMSVYARKELLSHSLANYKKSLSMEQVSVLVQKQDAPSPDYLFLSSTIVGNFEKKSFHITKTIAEFEPTMSGLSLQILENMEDVCGRELLKHTLCLITTSKYGLTESELLILLADVGMFDASKYRLTEEYSGKDKTLLLNPQTPLEKRLERQREPNSRLPYALWAPVRHLLQSHTYTSESSMEQLFALRLQRFVQTVESRYNLDSSETIQGRVFFHGRLASYFRARADPELQFSWRGDDFRAVQCLVHHLIRANDWITTSKILTDLGFLELSVSLGNCYGLCSDLSYALLESEKNDAIFSRHRISELKDVNTFLNANAELLHVHPKLLVQMMANETNTNSVSRMALNRALNGWEGRNWFRWINRPTLASNNIRTLRGHKGWIRSLALTKDRKYIVSAADDRTAKFWIGESGAFAHELRGHRASITSVDISTSSRFIITASMDSSVKLWDIELQVERFLSFRFSLYLNFEC
jgi:hypothetical protein